MATASGDVASMARQIERIVERPSWQCDNQIKGDLMKVLGKLTTVRVDVDLLKNTGIGKWVKKLTKYEDDVVRGYSSSLTDKWKAQVGVASEKVSKSRSSGGSSNGHGHGNGNGYANTTAVQQASAPAADTARYENARKKLQDKYAAEKAKREARTVQVINRPMGNKRRGATISAAPSRNSVMMSRGKAAAGSMQRHKTLPATSAMNRTVVARTVVPPQSSAMRRPLPSASSTSQSRSSSASLGPGDSDETRRRRRERLLALAQQSGGGGGSVGRDNDHRGAPSSAQRSTNNGRASSSTMRKSPSSAAHQQHQQRSLDPRKALLDKIIPRVCGVSTEQSKQERSRKSSSANGAASSSTSGSSGAQKKRKPENYTEGQRDVIQWLKSLDVDMSSYAPAFLDNGFDSIKLLNQVKSKDLETMVPKAGHQRMIETALSDLKRKHATAASSRPRSAGTRERERDRDRDLPRRKPRHQDSYFDEESDDSFVVSDGDEYAPGVITAMLRKGRKRQYSFDSNDSYNMEASYDEIQHEEERSKRIGEYEDYREELRNKKLLKKSK